MELIYTYFKWWILAQFQAQNTKYPKVCQKSILIGIMRVTVTINDRNNPVNHIYTRVYSINYVMNRCLFDFFPLVLWVVISPAGEICWCTKFFVTSKQSLSKILYMYIYICKNIYKVLIRLSSVTSKMNSYNQK